MSELPWNNLCIHRTSQEQPPAPAPRARNILQKPGTSSWLHSGVKEIQYFRMVNLIFFNWKVLDKDLKAMDQPVHLWNKSGTTSKSQEHPPGARNIILDSIIELRRCGWLILLVFNLKVLDKDLKAMEQPAYQWNKSGTTSKSQEHHPGAKNAPLASILELRRYSTFGWLILSFLI